MCQYDSQHAKIWECEGNEFLARLGESVPRFAFAHSIQAGTVDVERSLAEQLGRKPSRNDLDAQGEYKSGKYVQVFGSWVRFLREVGEYTEASYHYPQGTHLGHILSILYCIYDKPIMPVANIFQEFVKHRFYIASILFESVSCN